MYFVQSGRYDIGYAINKIVKYRIQFGARTIINGFALAYDMRSVYIYRASTHMKCMAIRKANWNKIATKHPMFIEALKINFLYFFNFQIRRNLKIKR